jgi:hypothetical protein
LPGLRIVELKLIIGSAQKQLGYLAVADLEAAVLIIGDSAQGAMSAS